MVEALVEAKDRKVVELKISEIITDEDMPDFNCRGRIDPTSCVELSQKIKTQGLLFPIIVRPFHDEISFPGKKWQAVAGYRRIMAHRILKRDTIEAFIKYDLDEVGAAILNLSENLDREDLNLMQEARAFGRLRTKLALSPKSIANHLGRSQPWVDVRLQALDLEPEIQTDIEHGMITQQQIKQIHGLPPGEPRFAAVRSIKSSKLRGDKRKVDIGPKKPRNVHAKKRRENNEIFEMQDHMLEEFGGGSLSRCPESVKCFIRMLGWAAGEATDMEVFTTLRKIAEQEKMEYRIPDDALDFLKNQ